MRRCHVCSRDLVPGENVTRCLPDGAKDPRTTPGVEWGLAHVECTPSMWRFTILVGDKRQGIHPFEEGEP